MPVHDFDSSSLGLQVEFGIAFKLYWNEFDSCMTLSVTVADVCNNSV